MVFICSCEVFVTFLVTDELGSPAVARLTDSGYWAIELFRLLSFTRAIQATQQTEDVCVRHSTRT